MEKVKTKSNFTKPKMVIFSSLKVSCGIGTILIGWVTFFATEYLGLSAATVGGAVVPMLVARIGTTRKELAERNH